MSNWITVDLYLNKINMEDYQNELKEAKLKKPNYPILKTELKKKFGCSSINEAYSNFDNDFDIKNDISFYNVTKLFSEESMTKDLLKNYIDNNSKNSSRISQIGKNSSYIPEIGLYVSTAKNIYNNYSKCLEYYNKYKEIENYIKNHPKIISFNSKNEEFQKRSEEIKIKYKSFIKSEYNVAGNLINVVNQETNQIYTYLIGSEKLNTMLAEKHFGSKSKIKVIRVKKIISEEDISGIMIFE